MDRWTQYLFENHSEEQLRSWAQRLTFFRFFRAYGGHANDGDSLDAAFAYKGTEQLESLLAILGVEPVKFDVEPPQPRLGVAYPGNVFVQFISLIPGTTWIRQPGHCDIMGVQAFIWCDVDKVKISLGDRYAVSEKNILEAEIVETLLSQIGCEPIDPPQDSRNYICPKYYPQYFNK